MMDLFQIFTLLIKFKIEGKNIFTHMNFNSQIDDDISAFPYLIQKR